MPEQTFTPKTYQDFLSAFPGGMDSGVAPLLLPKDQLAFAINVSLRGQFAKPRTPFNKKILNFGGNATLQAIVQTGLFQGAAIYRPDAGIEFVVAQIAGHLLTFTEIAGNWNVADISIPGDLNSATAPKAWMKQAEKWMVVQDGTGKLPIFYDGVAARRSLGASQTLATVSGVPSPAAPTPGVTITVTLTVPYSGPLNGVVIFNKAYYRLTTPSSQTALLTNNTAVAGTVYATGTNVVLQTGVVGFTTAASGSYGGVGLTNGPLNAPAANFQTGQLLSIFTTYSGYGGPGGTSVQTFKVIAILSATQVEIQAQFQNTGWTITANAAIKLTSGGNMFVIGTNTSAFTAPSIGVQSTINLSQVYLANAPAVVSLNGDYYTINPVVPGSTSTLALVNLTDTTTANYASGLTILSVPEIPAGRMMDYGMGCLCVSLTDAISYMVGDVVGSGSGTPAYNYRDAVLKITQNTFLAGGGSFRLPGTGESIASVIFSSQLDTSLGQGPLLVGTPFDVFSNVTPGTNPATWTSLTTPIQSESLIDKGPLSQDSCVLFNSDLFFRSYDGISSLIFARREFFSWGNKPQSNELMRVLNQDNQSLLNSCQGVSFDNRLFQTCSPAQQPSGVQHAGLVSLNTDLTNTLREYIPPAWEGLWTGLEILRLFGGRFNGNRRCFAFTFNNKTGQNEFYELLTETSNSYQDDNTPITWALETPVLFNKDIKPINDLVQLRDGEVYLSHIKGSVTVKVYFRPDFYPCWTLWNTFTVCQSALNANAQNGYRMRIGLGEPSGTAFELNNNRPLRSGYFFQFRFEITGYCVLKGMRVMAISQPQPVYAPMETGKPCQEIDCAVPNDFTLYQLQG